MNKTYAVTSYLGPAGDHNDHAMAQVGALGSAVAKRLGSPVFAVGQPLPADPADWATELARCLGCLREMAQRIDQVISSGEVPISAITRCAVALATQPVVLRHRPDAVVLWLDAHGDINVPDDSSTGYLGGMALSGPLGWWNSGLGAGLPPNQAVLVGARHLDPAESAHVNAGTVDLVSLGPSFSDRLCAVIAGRPIYLHVDCDVLEPGLVRTDYAVPSGMTLDDLYACCEAAAHSEVLGVEVGEFEGEAAATLEELLDALDPVIPGRV